MNRKPGRSRLTILSLLGFIIAVGIWSRTPGGHFPFPYKAVGDTLWATMFYLWILLLVPRVSTWRVALVTLAITAAIEFLKLYQAPWIQSLRAGRITGFLLGHTFFWYDFASYALGTLLAVAIDVGVLLRRRRVQD